MSQLQRVLIFSAWIICPLSVEWLSYPLFLCWNLSPFRYEYLCVCVWVVLCWMHVYLVCPVTDLNHPCPFFFLHVLLSLFSNGRKSSAHFDLYLPHFFPAVYLPAVSSLSMCIFLKWVSCREHVVKSFKIFSPDQFFWLENLINSHSRLVLIRIDLWSYCRKIPAVLFDSVMGFHVYI